MSMFGGSDNGDVGATSRGKRSREEKLLFEWLDLERKKVESDILNCREEQHLREQQQKKKHNTRMEMHRAEMAIRKQELDVKMLEVEAV
jgi:hypothetical protein